MPDKPQITPGTTPSPNLALARLAVLAAGTGQFAEDVRWLLAERDALVRRVEAVAGRLSRRRPMSEGGAGALLLSVLGDEGMSTAALAKATSLSSGDVSARMLLLVDRGYVVNTGGRGRGSRAFWWRTGAAAKTRGLDAA